MRKCKVVVLSLVTTITFLLTGCWDNVEINNRAFVLGIGLDKSKDSNKRDVTYQIALNSKSGNSGEESSGDGKNNETWNVTKTSSQILKTSINIQENIDKVLDLQHVQTLVIGEELAKKGILDDIDFFLRRPQIRRRMNIVYVNGKASDFMNLSPKTTKSPSRFIANILNTNIHYTDTVGSGLDLGELSENIRDGFDFYIIKVSIVDKQPVIDGVAVFKDGKFVCNVDEGEIKVLDWSKGLIQRGSIEVADPSDPTKRMTYEIHGGTVKLKPEFADNKVTFKMGINVEGDIAEKENFAFANTLEPSYIEAVEKAIREKMKSDIEDVYNKYEKEKRLDVLKLERKIKDYNIEFYDKNKNKLDDIIASSNIDISVTAKIRRVGLTR